MINNNPADNQRSQIYLFTSCFSDVFVFLDGIRSTMATGDPVTQPRSGDGNFS